jgi:hypothetical protein
MAEFFTKAALVTFGGAYAVLPYIYQGEFVWETDFLAVHSTRNKGKGFYFIAFEFDIRDLF